MNNPNVAFVIKINNQKVQFYFDPVQNTYAAIFGDRYHLGIGPILKKDEKGNWCDVNGTLDKTVVLQR